jgi:hypothetical protein
MKDTRGISHKTMSMRRLYREYHLLDLWWTRQVTATGKAYSPIHLSTDLESYR